LFSFSNNKLAFRPKKDSVAEQNASLLVKNENNDLTKLQKWTISNRLTINEDLVEVYSWK